jgi:hypothetical protein
MINFKRSGTNACRSDVDKALMKREEIAPVSSWVHQMIRQYVKLILEKNLR